MTLNSRSSSITLKTPPGSLFMGQRQWRHDPLRDSPPHLHGEFGFSSFELLIVVLIILIVGALAAPVVVSTVRGFRIAGDARSITGDIGIAKMRAAANFTHSRAYFDLSANTYSIQTWRKSNTSWVTEGGAFPLSQGVSLGFGPLSNPPSGTQSSLAQAPGCLDNSGKAIANTACVVFNSRGVPVDSTGAPTGNDALYITDGTSVYGVTVSATGLILTWRSSSHTEGWSKL